MGLHHFSVASSIIKKSQTRRIGTNQNKYREKIVHDCNNDRIPTNVLEKLSEIYGPVEISGTFLTARIFYDVPRFQFQYRTVYCMDHTVWCIQCKPLYISNIFFRMLKRINFPVPLYRRFQSVKSVRVGSIVIGDEILKGYVNDTNTHFLAKKCFRAGIKLGQSLEFLKKF